MANPFVYGEIVPPASFVDRETELDRLTADLLAGQKIFLISPRRYGKSSLVRRALTAAARGGALTVEVTVSSYSSYVAFLEGYARALLSVETRLDRARAWLRDMLGAVRPEVRVESDEHGGSQLALSFPSIRTDKDVSRLAQEVFALPGRIAEARHRKLAVALDEFQAIAIVRRRQCRARAPRRRPAAAPGRIRVFRIGAEPDGAHARPHPPVLQGGSGDAAAENPCRPLRGVHRGAVSRERDPAQRRGSGRRSSNSPATCPYDVQRLAHEVWDDVARGEERGPRGSARDAEAACSASTAASSKARGSGSRWRSGRASRRRAGGGTRAAVGRRPRALPARRRVDGPGLARPRSSAKTCSRAKARAKSSVDSLLREWVARHTH